MSAPTLCAACDQPLDPETAHEHHEDGCDRDWCYCEPALVHPTCCRTCPLPVIPGQIELIPETA